MVVLKIAQIIEINKRQRTKLVLVCPTVRSLQIIYSSRCRRDKQTNRQTDRPTDRQTDGLTDKKTERQKRQLKIVSGKQMDIILTRKMINYLLPCVPINIRKSLTILN